MSKHKHRAPRHRTPVVGAPKRALRNSILLSSLAVSATGVTGAVVSGGVLPGTRSEPVAADVSEADTAPQTAANLPELDLSERGEQVSRADNRERTDPLKAASLSVGEGEAVTVTEDVTDDDPRAIARALMAEFGFSQDQFQCLDNIWTQESNWQVDADNPTSSAYGIPQALPGYRMASVGSDWEWNPVTQIRWGLGYIADRYGTPCNAWGFKQGNGWY